MHMILLLEKVSYSNGHAISGPITRTCWTKASIKAIITISINIIILTINIKYLVNWLTY